MPTSTIELSVLLFAHLEGRSYKLIILENGFLDFTFTYAWNGQHILVILCTLEGADLEGIAEFTGK